MPRRKTPKPPRKNKQQPLRLTEEMRFCVDFLSALKRQSNNAFVEDAIARHVKHCAERYGFDANAIYHSVEGVRWLRIFVLLPHNAGKSARPDTLLFPLDETQSKRREFVARHAEFFYRPTGNETPPAPILENAEVLWPRIDEFMAINEKDAWAQGKAMAKVLAEHKIKPPTWPPTQARQ